MRIITSFLAGYVLILMVSDVDCFSRSGRKACSVEVRSRTTSYLTSHIQPVYQPYLTLCQGYRLCSKYRTAYKVSQRPAYRKISQPIYTCCPRWKWGVASHRLGCNIICHPPCQNGGTCSFLNMCSCTPGWTGRFCQTDVDECAGGTHGCSQVCLNVAGSHRCGCHRGYELQMDGKSCKAFPTDAPPASSPEIPAGDGSVPQSGSAGRNDPNGPTGIANPLFAAAGKDRFAQRTNLLPGGTAGDVFLQERTLMS
ncbi:epidermal growth factor-like protein 7 isoform X2 [Anolis carolinensis]|uniref:epidermal growth factor-like protein 7 isoform X2 n=1 Tax=Anolis carolinensis TaxID=28377 RepID=UPI002F2B5EB6